MTEASNYNMTAGGGSPGKDPASADVKYLSIAKVSEGAVLLNLPSASTKKAYAEEVSTEMVSRINLCVQFRKEAKDLTDGLREVTAYPDFRDTSESVYGMWYTSIDKNMIAYSGTHHKDV